MTIQPILTAITLVVAVATVPATASAQHQANLPQDDVTIHHQGCTAGDWPGVTPTRWLILPRQDHPPLT